MLGLQLQLELLQHTRIATPVDPGDEDNGCAVLWGVCHDSALCVPSYDSVYHSALPDFLGEEDGNVLLFFWGDDDGGTCSGVRVTIMYVLFSGAGVTIFYYCVG